MKKLVFSFIALFAGIATMFAQGAPEIYFEQITHDFGTFPEENGKVSCTFEFKNVGDADLVLQSVKASCGCTTPDWTKEPVKPGETGVVKATYNATGRPGSFTKTITVKSNAGEKRLTIKGEVIPKAQKVEDKYPFEVNGLRLMKKNCYFNTIYFADETNAKKGSTKPLSKTEVIEVINNGKEDIKVAFENGNPKLVSAKMTPEVLKAGERGSIEITINPKDSGVWGTFKKAIKVKANGKPADFDITLYGNVAEDFTNMTPEEKADAPVLTVGNTISLEPIELGKTKTFKFKVQNTGKNPLIIRASHCDAEGFTIKAPTKPIKAAKDGEIYVTVNTANAKAGKYTQRLTLTTNDPNRSTFVINLIGEIK
ncbi:MAG: DUF1573 domain-containing protein [Paludibacteraceae bacterium]|nr:DUF1573 domain-containing protein [Paludibacteraceae bacterium]MBP5481849.1 DUF1573 domain-containing protein [Paludibacteraceae bacterium]